MVDGSIVAKRQVVQTEKAPKAIGPYAQANIIGELVFVSGQIPLDPKTGELTGNDISEQTERVLENLKAVLEAAGSDLSRVIKTTVFLADMNDFTKMNDIYASYFAGGMFPSRSTVQVAALPKSALVEIDAIALL
jgi:2-iminobutanoate/2-iminopropanoate deaminase